MTSWTFSVPQPVAEPTLVYAIPRITFGCELEMCFVIRRKLFWDWKGEKDPRPAQLEAINLHTVEQIAKAELKRQNEAHPAYRDLVANGGNDGSQSAGSHESLGSWVSDPHTTFSFEMEDDVRNYMMEFFSHNLPTSPVGPSPLGEVYWGDKENTDYTVWTLQEDGSIRGHRKAWAQQTGRQLEDVKPIFLVAGGELVSPILKYDDLKWTASFKYIYNSLKFDGNHGVWLSGDEGLHVHFGLEDGAMGVRTVKHIMALYGLYLDEIEKWVDVRRRQGGGSQSWCQCIRDGMETRHFEQPSGNYKNRGLKYTPQEYVKRIYACPTIKHLKKEIWGERSADNPTAVEDLDDGDWGCMKQVAVNISLPIEDEKELTIEFRQHEGTVDPVVINWWVKFLGHLMSYASTLSRLRFRFTEGNNSESYSFLENMTKRRSILDVISFPQAGKDHFAARAAALHNQKFEDLREFESRLIDERIKKSRLGEKTGRDMDIDIKTDQWWLDRADELDAKWNIFIPQVAPGDEDSEAEQEDEKNREDEEK